MARTVNILPAPRRESAFVDKALKDLEGNGISRYLDTWKGELNTCTYGHWTNSRKSEVHWGCMWILEGYISKWKSRALPTSQLNESGSRWWIWLQWWQEALRHKDPHLFSGLEQMWLGCKICLKCSLFLLNTIEMSRSWFLNVCSMEHRFHLMLREDWVERREFNH